MFVSAWCHEMAGVWNDSVCEYVPYTIPDRVSQVSPAGRPTPTDTGSPRVILTVTQMVHFHWTRVVVTPRV